MDKADLPELAFDSLGDLVDLPGTLLYGSHETLCRGEAYYLGINPGGGHQVPVRDTISTMLTQTANAYLDQDDWEDSTLQVRTVYTLRSLGLEPRDVCSSNLSFVRSRSANGVTATMVERSWRVHEAMLHIVQPRLIVSCGNSEQKPNAYSHIKKLFGGTEFSVPSGHGGYWLKHFDTRINGRQVRVLGLPHLSWYKPEGRSEFTEWIQQVS